MYVHALQANAAAHGRTSSRYAELHTGLELFNLVGNFINFFC